MTLVSFYCPTHGLLVQTTPRAIVRCGRTMDAGVVGKRRCNKLATTVKPERKAA